MDAKKIALLVGALLIAGITAFMAKNMFADASAPKAAAAAVPVEQEGPEILVATRALPIGTIIQPDSFRFQPWPKDLVQNAYYLKGTADPASLAGTVVRAQITAGEPVTQGSLVKPGDRGFLAAALGPGMRAVTVSVSDSAGVAGFVFPGDRIDLVLTQTIEGDDGPSLRTSETIVRNLRVLATDQRTVSENEGGEKVVKTFNTVTLESTPRIAEKIAVSQTIGQLSLSLRSIADNAAELERAIASGSIKVPENGDPKAEREMLLAVANRPSDTGGSFVTGADVSRFQRRSVPKTMPKAPVGVMGGPAPMSMTGPIVAAEKAQGPVVRVSRGKSMTEVQVGGK